MVVVVGEQLCLGLRAFNCRVFTSLGLMHCSATLVDNVPSNRRGPVLSILSEVGSGYTSAPMEIYHVAGRITDLGAYQ